MIPGSFFEWDDQSDIVNEQIATVRTMPLYAMVITSDKGTEEWTRLSGKDWFDMYAVNGTVDFSRHGQPLLQAAMSINAGAELLCKRVVSDDACLANLAVVASTTVADVQKTNSDGEPLYYDQDGNETTKSTSDDGLVSYNPAMIETTTVQYTLKSAADCQTQEQVKDAIIAAVDEENANAAEGTQSHLLWIFFDNGRGESRKRIRITPNYALSKNYDNFFMYDLDIYESASIMETMHFCLDPDIINNGANISLQYQVNKQNSQLRAYQHVDGINAFMDTMLAAIGDDGTGLNPRGYDLLFGTNKKTVKIPGIEIDTEGGVNLRIVSGSLLMNGSYGSFGNAPIEAEDYDKMLAKAFAGYIPTNTMGTQYKILTAKEGCYDPIIYNVDRNRIDAVVDANYPNLVKRAIEQLVTYREDCFYFRDMGTDCNTMELILAADMYNMHTKFAGTYCTYYDVINPYSKKQITVTMMYSFAQLIVKQFNNGRNLPMAGIRYGFVITDAIDGTVGFTPTICPGLNQKEELVDAHINYATYIDNSLVIETLYTSQDKYTQLSFINNVLSVQEVIKEIRRRCPAIRYSFIDGEDLEKYRADVEEIISPFISNFSSLQVQYKNDPYYARNKIFYAVLAVRFREFVQTEYFRIVALGGDTTVDASLSAGAI